MPLYSDKELEQLRKFEDLEEAVENPDDVIRFSAYRNEDAAGLARVTELRNLQSLSISLSDVSQLLPRLGELMDLQYVYLQACSIQTFPESILSLRNLRFLSIGNNSLSSLPDVLSCLVKLEWLGFSQNQLQCIPKSIGNLATLKTLNLSYNQLEAVPDSIGKLSKLESLLLDANQLQRVPDTIGSLNCLQRLSLNYNKLRTLPDSICNLLNLEYLSIECNPFDSLPRCLSNIQKGIKIEAGKRSLFMDWSYRRSEKPPQIELNELKLFVAPNSDLFEPLTATIQKGQLSKVSSVIVGAARDAVKIESSVPDDYSRLGSSRLGGFPDLQKSSLYPKTDGLYWSFLAQINLADIAPFNNYLPRSGLISFFLDSTEALNGKVLYYMGDSRKLITVRHGGADELVSPDDDYTQNPHGVRFGHFFSLPYRFPNGILSDQDCEAYEMCEDLHKSIEHHMNGYTFTQHESPQDQAASKMGGLPDEWVPLLQLGSDGKVGFCFWDAGTLTFTIHREDLRRWDFSRVHVSLETS